MAAVSGAQLPRVMCKTKFVKSFLAGIAMPPSTGHMQE